VHRGRNPNGARFPTCAHPRAGGLVKPTASATAIDHLPKQIITLDSPFAEVAIVCPLCLGEFPHPMRNNSWQINKSVLILRSTQNSIPFTYYCGDDCHVSTVPIVINSSFTGFFLLGSVTSILTHRHALTIKSQIAITSRE